MCSRSGGLASAAVAGPASALLQRARPRACQPRRPFSTAEEPGAEEDQSQPPSLPLHKLVKAGDPAAVATYLETELDSGAVNIGDPALAGTTPLLLALRLGRDTVAEVLLERGADANLPGAWGLTPLMYGAVFGREAVVAAMLDRGGAAVDVHAADAHGSTALAHAQAERQHAIVALLVEHISAHGGGAPDAGGESEVTHSGSGFNIRPMTEAQIEGASRRLAPLARAVSLEGATEPAFQGKTIDGTRWVRIHAAPRQPNARADL